jgi:hypothetical protein
MDERRRHARTAVSWPTRMWLDDETLLVGATSDVSASGIFLATAPTAAVKLGKCYRVDVLTDGGSGWSFVGEVRHMGERGIGLMSDRLLD